MSNIFETLDHEQRSSIPEEEFDAPQKIVESPAIVAATEMEQEMVCIYRNINAFLPDSPGKVIQFISSRPNEGVSTIVREFASMAVAKMGKSVLIIDAAQGNGDQRNFFRINNIRGWDEAVSDLPAMDKTINSIGDSNLYVSCLSCSSVATRQFETCQLSAFFESLKMRFDYVLVDSPPATTAVDGIVLSSYVDGVVLVVEAEKTRWPVAEKMKKNIQKSGGKILGVVLNKRRFHIPEYLYRML